MGPQPVQQETLGSTVQGLSVENYVGFYLGILKKMVLCYKKDKMDLGMVKENNPAA